MKSNLSRNAKISANIGALNYDLSGCLICTHSLRVILSVRTLLGEPKVQFEGSLPLAAITDLDGQSLMLKELSQ